MRMKKLKKAVAVLLSFAMILGMMPAVTRPIEVQAATNIAPDSAYWTDVDGLKSYNMNSSNPKGKIRFGKNSDDVREWYIAGVDTMGTDGTTDDTLAFLSTSQFGTGIYGVDSRYSATVNKFFQEGGYFATYLSKDTNAYFSDAEIDRMQNMTVSTLECYQEDDETPYTASGKLYLPDAQNRNSYGSDVIYIGTKNNIPITLEGLNITTDNALFWLRSPSDTINDYALVAVPGSYVDEKPVSDIVSVVPAFNLNLSDVSFASAAKAAASSYKGDKANSTMTAGTYTLRYAPAPTDRSWENISAEINIAGTSVNVTNANGKYLMVQNSKGVYASAISGADTTINASTITIGGTVLTDFNNCKVWVESTTDNITTAKLVATANLTVTAIETIDITIDAPAVGNALDTTAACATTGVSSTAPTVTWTTNDETAEYNKSYTAGVTLEAADGYEFTDRTAVTVNGKAATVTKNPEGTLTVSYAFPKTAARELTDDYYATKNDLIDCFGLDVNEKVGKVIFGQNGSGSAQEWKIAGKDTGVSGDNIVLFAATPLLTNKVFNSEYDYSTKPYVSEKGGNYGAANVPASVYVNHYGMSDLRQTIQSLEKNTGYFSSIEKGLMNDTTITTNDILNGVAYATTDKLYAAYGDCDDQYITVGTNTATQLNSGIKIDRNNWGSSGAFWLRSPSDADSSIVLMAYPGRDVGMSDVNNKFSVVPAFNLNLSFVLFASAAKAASPSYNGDQANSTMTENTYTLRYTAGESDALNSASAQISADQKKIKITGAAAGMYLMVQNSDGAYAVDVSGNPLVAASDITIAESKLSTFDGCKVWLETTDADRITTAKAATLGEQNWYNVNITAGSNMTKTTESGAVSQNGITAGSAMTAVVYTAEEGYYFPDPYVVEAQNGVTVTRDSDSQITVSGTPTADVEIALTAATAKPGTAYSKLQRKLTEANALLSGETQYTTATLNQLTDAITAAEALTSENSNEELTGAYDTLTAKISALVEATAEVQLSSNPSNSGILSGGGRYAAGDEVEISCKAVTGYTFEGWYVGGVKQEELGTTFTRTIEASDTVLAYEARYTANETKKLSIAVGNGSITYQYNDETKESSNDLTDNLFLKGTYITVTASANDEYTFLYWMDTVTKKVLTNQTEYSFYLSDTVNIKACYRKSVQEQHYVVFKDLDGKILWSGDVADQTAATEPEHGTFTGYTFDGWNKIFTSVTEDMIIVAQYKKNGGYTVTASGGTIVSEKESYTYGDFVRVQAAETDGDKYFSGWYAGETLVSANREYSFYVVGSTELTAQFNGEAVIVPEPMLNLTMSSRTTLENGKQTIQYNNTWSVPEGYSVMEAGLVFTFTDDQSGNLTLEKADNSTIYKRASSLTTTEGTYAYTLTLGAVSKLKNVHAVGYLTYVNDATGEIVTRYTSLYTSNAN